MNWFVTSSPLKVTYSSIFEPLKTCQCFALLCNNNELYHPIDFPLCFNIRFQIILLLRKVIFKTIMWLQVSGKMSCFNISIMGSNQNTEVNSKFPKRNSLAKQKQEMFYQPNSEDWERKSHISTFYLSLTVKCLKNKGHDSMFLIVIRVKTTMPPM